MLRPWRLPLAAAIRQSFQSEDIGLAGNLPELIGIYFDADCRSHGSGTTLLGLCEEQLVELNKLVYSVKTADNAAIRFYLRNGFHQVAGTKILGSNFAVFEKPL